MLFTAHPIHLAEKTIIDKVLKCDFGIDSVRIMQVEYQALSEEQLRKRKYLVSVRGGSAVVEQFIVNARKMKGEYWGETTPEAVHNALDFAAYVLSGR